MQVEALRDAEAVALCNHMLATAGLVATVASVEDVRVVCASTGILVAAFEAILGKRRWGGNQSAPARTYYTVRWVGGEVTEVLAEDMTGSEELVADFEAGLCEAAHAMLLSALSESEKAVRELLRKEGLPGDLQDWVAAYDSEFQ